MAEIPRAVMARILKNAGAPRISDKAAEKFAELIEEKASEVAKKAVRLSEHSGRKTVMIDDVKAALRSKK